MKKQYVKPKLLCQEIRPETILCSCTFRNPSYNEVSQCGYTPEDLGFTLFAIGWADCAWEGEGFGACYQVNMGLIFGS